VFADTKKPVRWANSTFPSRHDRPRVKKREVNLLTPKGERKKRGGKMLKNSDDGAPQAQTSCKKNEKKKKAQKRNCKEGLVECLPARMRRGTTFKTKLKKEWLRPAFERRWKIRGKKKREVSL